MSKNVTLMEQAGQFQALVEKAEFLDHEGNSLDCEKGIQKNLGIGGIYQKIQILRLIMFSLILINLGIGIV